MLTIKEAIKSFSTLDRSLFIFIFAFGILMLIQEFYYYRKTKISYHRSFSIFFAFVSMLGFFMLTFSFFAVFVRKIYVWLFIIFLAILVAVAVKFFIKAMADKKKTTQNNKAKP